MCGGQSARMGTDKGLLLQNNKTWASMAAQKLKPYVTEVYFSVNINQVNCYSEVFETSKLKLHEILLILASITFGCVPLNIAKDDTFE